MTGSFTERWRNILAYYELLLLNRSNTVKKRKISLTHWLYRYKPWLVYVCHVLKLLLKKKRNPELDSRELSRNDYDLSGTTNKSDSLFRGSYRYWNLLPFLVSCVVIQKVPCDWAARKKMANQLCMRGTSIAHVTGRKYIRTRKIRAQIWTIRSLCMNLPFALF